jgi:hypothetical protein
MLKLGTHSEKQLSARTLESWRGRRKFAAATLYPVAKARDRRDGSHLAEAILRRLPTASGGLFVTGSNGGSGSTAHGAIYTLRGGRFQKLAESGAGAPVDRFLPTC